MDGDQQIEMRGASISRRKHSAKSQQHSEGRQGNMQTSFSFSLLFSSTLVPENCCNTWESISRDDCRWKWKTVLCVWDWARAQPWRERQGGGQRVRGVKASAVVVIWEDSLAGTGGYRKGGV
jgi:hypothetical protein